MAAKRCRLCQKFFYPIRQDQKYCPRCGKQKAYYIPKLPIIKTCLYCKKEFKTSKKIQKFCSMQCKNNYHRSYIKKERVCKYCGKKFITTNKNQYCSREHYLLAKAKRDSEYYMRKKNDEISES